MVGPDDQVASGDGELRALIEALDTEDPRELRRVGDQIDAAGRAALPDLIRTLTAGPPAARKAAAYLLRRHKSSAEATAALGHAVTEDAEPKVRKNAAVSLGKIGAPAAVGALATAVERETVAWVRPSLILALGAIGGETAAAALGTVTPQAPDEREALRKALDRCRPQQRTVRWRPEGCGVLRLVAEVPVGLEHVAIAESRERGFDPPVQVGPGRLRWAAGVSPWDLIPRLRCAYGLLIEVGQGPRLDVTEPERHAAALTALISGSTQLRSVRDWLDVGDDPLRYRFAVEDVRLPRTARRALLEAVRAGSHGFGMEDSPSAYDVELILRVDAAGAALFIRPSFHEDTRFAYRVSDVGAALNPVVAACLARLVRLPGSQTVFDPTCGSGTLLIERALLDPGAQALGLDVSRTSVAAARRNAAAAGLGTAVRIARGDAASFDRWPNCDEVLANLPFGIRSRRQDIDLAALYRALVDNLSRRLSPDGRALLYTASKRLVETCIQERRRQLLVEQRLTVQSGGLNVGIWLLRSRR